MTTRIIRGEMIKVWHLLHYDWWQLTRKLKMQIVIEI